ncbi:MAG TPA: hypothetical protein VGI72_02840 [Gaiellales bacterium]
MAAGVLAAAVMLTASADAAVWQVAPSASPNPYKNFLTAVARVPGTSQFWAAGYTLDQAGPAHSLIEASSGGAFAESPIPRMGRFEQLLGVAAASPAHAWAVGGSFVHASLPLIFVWDGSAWRRTPAPLPAGAAGGTLTSVRAFSATDVTAVGTWFSATATGGPLIEHWNGHLWRASTARSPSGCQGSFTSIAAVPGSSTRFAVGYCAGADSTSDRALIERSSGSGWSIVGDNAPAGSSLQSVTPVSATAVWAVGSTTDATGAKHPLAERWDGSRWAVVPTPDPSGNAWLQSVVRVPGTGTLWAVGSAIAGATTVGIAEQWTGSAWQAVPPVQPGDASNLQGVAAAPGTVWAVGDVVPTAPGSGPITQTLAELTGG